MNFTMKTESKDRGSIRQFFFAEEVPYSLALVRIVLPLVLLLDMGPRWFHAREFYSADGAAAPLALNYGFDDFLPVPGGTIAVGMTTALVFSLVCASIGWCGRLALIISTALYTWLTLLDCLATMTKYTVIASHILLLLSLSPCSTVWSVDSLLRRRSARRHSLSLPGVPANQAFPVWPRRLLQFLIGVVYIGAAFTKMHTPAFFSSDQMRHWMLTNVNQANPVGEYLSFYPEVLIVAAYVTIIWEVLFVFLAWQGWGRVSMITLGVIFHLGTFFLLGLDIFPLVCYSTYLAFLGEKDIQRISAYCRRLLHRHRHSTWWKLLPAVPDTLIPAVSPRFGTALFGATLAVVLTGGIGLEHWLDPFATRRAEGALPLREIDAEIAQQMLRRPERIREVDKYLSFEIGSDMIGDVLTGRRNAFHHGETVVAQSVLNPPHEDMWIECNLLDQDGHIVERVGQIVERSSLRASWAFQITEALKPGVWYLAIHSNGREISRREITILPRPLSQ